MTPTQLAQAECANYDRGQCLGVLADSLGTGHLVLAKERGACSVEQKRCDYFEKCVLPMADSEHPDSPDYKTARAAYRAKHGMKLVPEDIRLCQCGEVLGKRQRVCPRCAVLRRRESYRRADTKRRNPAIPEIAMSANS